MTTHRDMTTPRYSATLNAETMEVVLIRDLPAGVSGPANEWSLDAPDGYEGDSGTLLPLAADILFSDGYLVAGPWERGRYGDQWHVDLTAMQS